MTDRRPRALIVTGGIFHDFDATGPMVARLLAEAGFAADLAPGAGPGLARFAAEGADLLVVHALAWSMTQDEKYAPHRAAHAYAPPEAVRLAIARHLAAGGGLLGLHTAAICFDTWPDWGGTLGAAWVWGRSHHPPPGPVSVTLAAPRHPALAGAEDFALIDELYCDMALAPDAEVLAVARATGGPPQPVVTVRTAGEGRVAYSALGHDAAAFAEPRHARLLAALARWLGRME